MAKKFRPPHKLHYDEKTGTYSFVCYPKKSTLALDTFHRTIGRMASISTDQKPIESGTNFDLGADLFESFYFPEVPPLEGEAIPEERRLTAMIMDWFRSGLVAAGFQGETYENIAAAAAAASIAWTYLTQDEVIKKILALQEELEKLLEQYGGGEGQPEDKKSQQQKEGEAQLNEARAKVAQLTEKIAKSTFNQKTLEGKVAKAAKAGVEQGEATRDLTDAIGYHAGSEDGEDFEVDVRPIMDFMNKHKSWIGALVKAIGRARRTALRAAAYAAPTPHPIATGAYTQDLMSIHPQELALLTQEDEALAMMAMMDWYDRGLFGWVQKADKREDGQFVMSVDVSGSMGGTEFVIATAVAIGLALAARDKQRKYSLYKFDTRITARVDSTQNWKDHLKWVTANSGGGTEFDPPLIQMAKDIEAALEARQGDSRGMDAVILSDGYASMSKPTVKRWEALKKQGVRLLYISVGDGYGELEKLATKKLELHKLDLDNADLMAATVGKWLAD